MPITMTEARNVKIGDVLSTDGGKVVEKHYNSARNAYTFAAIAHGVRKEGTFNANETLPIWTPEN